MGVKPHIRTGELLIDEDGYVYRYICSHSDGVDGALCDHVATYDGDGFRLVGGGWTNIRPSTVRKLDATESALLQLVLELG